MLIIHISLVTGFFLSFVSLNGSVFGSGAVFTNYIKHCKTVMNVQFNNCVKF